jgi:hypothetical protein
VDLQQAWGQTVEQFGAYQHYIWFFVILFVGWMLSWALSQFASRLVRRTGLDERVVQLLETDSTATRVNVAKLTGTVVFWTGLLITLVVILNYVQLGGAAEPLNELVGVVLGYVPRALGALLILVVAWVVARILRSIVTTVLSKTSLDERMTEELSRGEAREVTPVSTTLGDVAYWLVFLLFLPAVLDTLQLEGLLDPVRAMFGEIFGYLPNLLSAAAIFAIGWFVARLLQRIVTNLLAATGVDKLSDRLGFQKALGENRMSHLLGVVVHILIIIPVAIMALDALGLESITRPASQMLSVLLDALPLVFAAGLVLIISYFIGRVVAELVTNLLSSAGFDNILVKLGVAGEGTDLSKRAPSNVGGDIVMIAVMLFAFIEAAEILGFSALATLTSELLVLAGHILLGLAIFALGLYLSRAAAAAIEGSQMQQSRLLANIARVAILILAGAMGLRQMGLANEIITAGFTIILGAVAVALALAFGLGARDEAAREVRRWRDKLDRQKEQDERR